jgi:hypothetical protein
VEEKAPKKGEASSPNSKETKGSFGKTRKENELEEMGKNGS